MTDRYGYIGIETLLNYCQNSKDHSITPNDFMRMNRVRIEEPKQGEWIQQYKNDGGWHDMGYFYNMYKCSNCGSNGTNRFNFCPNCGADMSKLQANGDQVKNELNRVSKELNSKTEYKAKVKELENAIAKCEKAEEEFKKRTCKFKSPTNCDFCSFHSDCDEHWKEGDEK